LNRYDSRSAVAENDLAFAPVPSRDYYETLWQTLPEGLEPSGFSLRRDFLLANVAAGERVLDVGCGDGAFASALVAAGVSVAGADVARSALARAALRAPGAELGLIEAGEPWPFEDGAFDAVWAGEVLEHVADTAPWLSELRRVLRPGGRLLLSTPAHGRARMLRLALDRGAFAEHFEPRSEHLRFYSARTLTELLEDFHFEDVSVRAAGGPPGARRLLLARALRARH
jgi:SAM-dependent methyltransferase